MQIFNILPTIDKIQNDSNYLQMLESHLTYFKALPSNTYITVTSQQNYKYEGDFYGLLNDVNVDKNFHYIVMRLNGIENSCDYKGDINEILVPDLTEVRLINNIYQTKAM